MDDLFDGRALDEKAVMERVSCGKAGELKQQWSVVSQAKLLETEFAATFSLNDAWKFARDKLNEVAVKQNYDEFESKYESTRDKVCELCAARGLCRDLKTIDGVKESRKAAVQKSMQTVKGLKGVLPPRLGMIVYGLVGVQTAPA